MIAMLLVFLVLAGVVAISISSLKQMTCSQLSALVKVTINSIVVIIITAILLSIFVFLF